MTDNDEQLIVVYEVDSREPVVAVYTRDAFLTRFNSEWGSDDGPAAILEGMKESGWWASEDGDITVMVSTVTR